MSEAAIGNWQAAIGKTRGTGLVFEHRRRAFALSFREVGGWPTAECRMSSAILCAIPCTVTPRQTSVTTLALVESGLIIVGRANCRWAETAANRGFGLAAHCSFQGDMCIQ
jgi:hypothetical protein